MGIRIHYGDKEQFYDFTPIPYEVGVSVNSPIEVAELPEPTEEIVGKVFYDTTNGVYYICEQTPTPTIGDRIYFDTTKDPRDYFTPDMPENPLLVFGDQQMLTGGVMLMDDERALYVILAVFGTEFAAPYVYCDNMTVEEFNETILPALPLPLPTVTEFGWQTDSISLGTCAGWPLEAAMVNNLANYDNIAYLKVSNFTFKTLDKTDEIISGSVTKIVSPVIQLRDQALNGCKNLTSVNFPNATSIGEYALSECAALESVNIPNVTNVGRGAFSTCTSLESAVFPNVTAIGEKAFYSCTALESVTFGSTIPPTLAESYYEGSFRNCPALTSIYVPAESVDAYKTAEGWSEYADKIKPTPQE